MVQDRQTFLDKIQKKVWRERKRERKQEVRGGGGEKKEGENEEPNLL